MKRAYFPLMGILILIYISSTGCAVDDPLEKVYSTADKPVLCFYVGDFDGIDDDEEIIVGLKDSRYSVVYFEPDDISNYHFFQNPISLEGPCKSINVLDIDDKPEEKEIIIITDTKINVFDRFGNEISSFPLKSMGDVYIGDITGDRKKEIIIGADNVTILDSGLNKIAECDINGHVKFIKTAEDGTSEIIAASDTEVRVFILDKNMVCEKKWNYPVEKGEYIMQMYVDKNEIIVGIKSGKSGKIHVLYWNGTEKEKYDAQFGEIISLRSDDLSGDNLNEIIAGFKSAFFIYGTEDSKKCAVDGEIQKVYTVKFDDNNHILLSSKKDSYIEIFVYDRGFHEDNPNKECCDHFILWHHSVQCENNRDILLLDIDTNDDYEDIFVSCKGGVHHIILKYTGEGAYNTAKYLYDQADKKCSPGDGGDYEWGKTIISSEVKEKCNNIINEKHVKTEWKEKCRQIIKDADKLFSDCDRMEDKYNSANESFSLAKKYFENKDFENAKKHADYAKKLYHETKPSEIKKCEELISDCGKKLLEKAKELIDKESKTKKADLKYASATKELTNNNKKEARVYAVEARELYVELNDTTGVNACDNLIKQIDGTDIKKEDREYVSILSLSFIVVVVISFLIANMFQGEKEWTGKRIKRKREIPFVIINKLLKEFRRIFVILWLGLFIIDFIIAIYFNGLAIIISEETYLWHFLGKDLFGVLIGMSTSIGAKAIESMRMRELTGKDIIKSGASMKNPGRCYSSTQIKKIKNQVVNSKGNTKKNFIVIDRDKKQRTDTIIGFIGKREIEKLNLSSDVTEDSGVREIMLDYEHIEWIESGDTLENAYNKMENMHIGSLMVTTQDDSWFKKISNLLQGKKIRAHSVKIIYLNDIEKVIQNSKK
ncbi:MAG: hypothetical protein A7315_02300 [Candidatus Altiarchaeales archaeon WOR_SM1_79]|nr:MAG: hypothetical protein A7315_02300 [Candidatus Altiarchaeales archaeon WOR_SM1_79]